MDKKLEIIVQQSDELEPTELDERDCDYHRWYLHKAFAGMLHERSAYDKCERIFRSTFETIDWFIM